MRQNDPLDREIGGPVLTVGGTDMSYVVAAPQLIQARQRI